MNQKFRLSPSTVASYFKHRCDRQFRWNSVETPDRGRAGIGWNVPRAPRFTSRPGIDLLLRAGDEFEVGRLELLTREHGDDQVHHAGLESDHGRQTVRPLPLPDLAARLHRPAPPRFFAQIFIDLEALGTADAFLDRFGLDPARVRVGTARPDLLEVVRDDAGNGCLRVWDFKASQAARHEHFIQVAFYTFLLEAGLTASGLDGYAVDAEWGVIYSREGPDSFLLDPYRMVVADFLRYRAMALLESEAREAHFHVNTGCPMCQYSDICRAEAEVGRDLSRVAYMTSESKRRLVAHGIRSHSDLALLAEDSPLWAQLRLAGHDLSVNLPRYVAVAQALEDGRPRSLDSRSLTAPAWEDVRVILSAEQDPVTNTCFSLGLKTFEGFDAKSQPAGAERVFVLENPLTTPDAEATLLHDFLHALNELLVRVDGENAALALELELEGPDVAEKRRAAEAATAELAAFKEAYPRLRRDKPDHAPLLVRREALAAVEKAAKDAHKQAGNDAWRQNRRRQKRLHFYVYDGFDLTVLKRLVERHLFSATPELAAELAILIRLFPPESVLPDADSFRSIPGTVVANTLRQLVALPSPYIYDLRTVTDRIPPTGDGRQPYRFRPSIFVFPGTNQVAFERIHDVWNGRSFLPNPREPASAMTPDEVRQRIERTVRDKLRATDAVVQWLKREYRDALLLRKEPFRLYATFDPLGFQTLDALRVFALLETSLAEMEVKYLHTLPPADRVARFECISGLRYVEGADTADGGLWFTFDPEGRDARFERGAFDLVVTPEDAPERLVAEIDGPLFDSSRWRHAAYKVDLVDYDLAADPPRVCLKPGAGKARFAERVDLAAVHVLDKAFIDYNTPKVLVALERLGSAGEAARHVHELLAGAGTTGWRPLIDNLTAVEDELRRRAPHDRDGRPLFLNPAQLRAFRGAIAAPLSLIWGPPGTGKTFMLGHLLLAYVLAAEWQNRPVRILVTAFTHNAIGNVLNKVVELLAAYGLAGPGTVVAKVHGSQGPDGEDRLPSAVARVPHKNLPGLLAGETPRLIVGSTVWGVASAMKEAGDGLQSWFDVILIDEASQMKLPEALIAFSAGAPDGTVILAGDDRQLPPIIHGAYPEEHEAMLSSVFAYMRDRIEARDVPEPGFAARAIFQLEDNFRANKPLIVYQGDALYNGRFFSQQPGIRIRTQPPAEDTDDLIDFLLHPDRPVVLVRYSAPISFTARNPLEAELAAHIATRLLAVLVPPGADAPGDAAYFAAQGFAILAPHRAQNAAIRGLLAHQGFGTPERPLPLVDTVDKLQGQERDVVVVSYGVADEEYAEAEAEFLLSSNRFNVATTRPRHKLIVLCSDAVLDVVPQEREVLLEAMLLKRFRGFCDSGMRSFAWETAEYGPVALTVQWKGFV